jgi:hypothetical protein
MISNQGAKTKTFTFVGNSLPQYVFGPFELLCFLGLTGALVKGDKNIG